MHEVFINYRTGDGDEVAALLERALAERFGADRTFRAVRGVQPGESYPERLLAAVRHSSVLLAVMGPEWAHDLRLRDDLDWVRREILAAIDYGICVIPVLKGRKTDQLNPADLPPDLKRLANVQSLRLDTRDNEADLTRIGDALAHLVPSLRKADRAGSRSPAPGAVHSTARDIHGTLVQGRDIGGDAGTVIKGNLGPVHTGDGHIYQGSQHFSEASGTYIRGDSHRGIGRPGGAQPDEDEK
jgi:hypothetical protein